MPTQDEFHAAYNKHNGNRTAMAEELGVSRGSTYNWCVKHEEEQGKNEVREVRDAEAKAEKLKKELEQERARRVVAEEDLEELRDRAGILDHVSDRDVNIRDLPQPTQPMGEGCTAIVCCTDWHLEKKILPSTVSGLNSFNLNIAQARIDRLWQKSVYLIDFFRHIANVNEVLLWFGGDLIQNHLHDEDVESNNLGPTEAVALLQDHMATGIAHLAKNVKDSALRVVCNYGNHARTTRFQRQGTGWKHNFEWLAYETMARVFSGIPFKIEKGYMNYCNVQGYNVRFHHGEAVKYAGGVGGLQIPMNKALAQWDKAVHADYSINGHYHTYKDEWTWTSCGCLCGYDSFAQSIKADYQEPTQTIVFIDSKRGKVLSCPIFVEKPVR